MFGEYSDNDEAFGFGGRGLTLHEQLEQSREDASRSSDFWQNKLAYACHKLIDAGVLLDSDAELSEWFNGRLVLEDKQKRAAEAKAERRRRAEHLFDTKPMGMMTREEIQFLKDAEVIR